MNALRFHQVGVIANCEGLLHCEGDHLCLEYQHVDGLLGALKSSVKQVNIPLADLASVELAGGWLRSPRIVLNAKRMEAVRSVPGMSQGRVELLVARSDRESARRFVDGLRKPAFPESTGLEE